MNYSMRYWASSISNPHYFGKPLSWSVLDHTTQKKTVFNFKADALLFKKKLPHATVYFHWYEQEMSRLDWSKEPEESYYELCKQRAQELRDTYDYVRLWYSGGADSHSALTSFVDNNIHIDEIIILLYPDLNKSNILDSTAHEVILATFPQLKSVIHAIPNTKITTITATETEISSWFNSMSDEFTTIDALDGDGGAQFHLDINWGVSKKLAQTDLKNWCDIHGGSKAKLFKNGNRWYSFFIDTSVNTFYMSDRSEDFFVSRNVPKLFLKTVYNYKKYHETIKSTDHCINTMYLGMDNHYYNRALGRSQVHEVAEKNVYHTTHNSAQWNKMLISGEKATKFYNNVISTSQGQRWYQQHVETQKLLINEYSDFWNLDEYQNPVPYLGYKGNLSTFYCLNDGLSYDSSQVGYK